MFGNVFLGSIFKGLDPIRDYIWREVQKLSQLKCISFQTEHIVAYPERILSEIRTAIDDSDFFIILIGPEYGMKLSESGVPPEENQADWGLSFGHYEFKLAVSRLKSFTDPSGRTALADPVKRMLLINLKKTNASPPSPEPTDLGDFRKFAKVETDQLGAGSETFYVDSHAGGYGIIHTENRRFEIVLERFLRHANSLAEQIQHAKYLKRFQIRHANHIHVAGWSGIEDDKLYSSFAKEGGYQNDSFSFLTMDRSIIELPTSARYFPRLDNPYLTFDFLFSDIEVVNFHKERGYVGSLNGLEGADYVKSCFGRSIFGPNISRYRDRFYPGGLLHAVPLLYGFNEMIVKAGNPIVALRAKKTDLTSYSEFDLPTLLGNSNRVALWGWWVVTFPIILFAHAKATQNNIRKAGGSTTKLFDDLSDSDIRDVKSFADWVINTARDRPEIFEKTIKVMVNSILEAVEAIGSYERISVARSLDTLSGDLRDGLSDVVLGGTSGVLACCQTAAGSYQTMIPREGVYTWINCVCPTPNAGADGEFLEKMIKHWVSPDVQIRLSLGVGPEETFDPSTSSKQYIGIPANREAERKFRSKIERLQQFSPISDTLNTLEERTGSGTLSTSWLRPFPQEQAAFLMEYYWNVLVRKLHVDFKT